MLLFFPNNIRSVYNLTQFNIYNFVSIFNLLQYSIKVAAASYSKVEEDLLPVSIQVTNYVEKLYPSDKLIEGVRRKFITILFTYISSAFFH